MMYGTLQTDILIAGSGCSGLYCALHLPMDKQILIITKADVESCDSFLAQGGICMLKNQEDYASYYEDTMKAGHYENDKQSVKIMLHSSKEVIQDLIVYGVGFQREENGELSFTREGGHSNNRILYHKDITGKEITTCLYREVKKMRNVTIMEYTTMLDVISANNNCYGVIAKKKDGKILRIKSDETVLATGGIGGLYSHTTNYRHLTGDAIAIALKHGIQLRDINYVQIHPTTFYSGKNENRSFLISESVRGEGAKLFDKNKNRFVNELLPRDILTTAIYRQMKKDGTNYVWEDLRSIPEKELKSHFPNIVKYCREKGFDVTKECIPVVPAQHYLMGGIKVDHNSATSMERLYAIGETACNGVHGKNRLASNSLLESLVFAKRAAYEIAHDLKRNSERNLLYECDLSEYENQKIYETKNKILILKEINKRNK